MNKLSARIIGGVLHVTKPDGSKFTYDKEIKEFSPIGADKKSFHDYDANVILALKGESTLENAWKAALYNPAPQSNIRTKPVKHGEVFDIQGFLGNVRTLTFPEQKILINIALHGHTLEPGIVIRHVYQDRNGHIRIVTKGIGNGILPDANEFVGSSAFAKHDLLRTKTLLTNFGKNPIPENFTKLESVANHSKPYLPPFIDQTTFPNQSITNRPKSFENLLNHEKHKKVRDKRSEATPTLRDKQVKSSDLLGVNPNNRVQPLFVLKADSPDGVLSSPSSKRVQLAKPRPKPEPEDMPKRGPERVKYDPSYNPYDREANGFDDLEGEAFLFKTDKKRNAASILASGRQKMFSGFFEDIIS